MLQNVMEGLLYLDNAKVISWLLWYKAACLGYQNMAEALRKDVTFQVWRPSVLWENLEIILTMVLMEF